METRDGSTLLVQFEKGLAEERGKEEQFHGESDYR